MEIPETAYSRPIIEPPAPVNGGVRWRSRYHDLLDLIRAEKGLDTDGEPAGDEPSGQEPQAFGAPHIATTPPTEASVGGEYMYQARAFDNNTDGFTWYLEKGAPGMRVDRHSGALAWTPTEGGYVEVALCARSLYGAVSRQSWTVCVRKAAPVRKGIINKRFSEALHRKVIRKNHPLPFRWPTAWRRTTVGRRATAPPGERLHTVIPLRR